MGIRYRLVRSSRRYHESVSFNLIGSKSDRLTDEGQNPETQRTRNMTTKNVKTNSNQEILKTNSNQEILDSLKGFYVNMSEAFASGDEESVQECRTFLVERLRKVTSLLSVQFDKNLANSNYKVAPIRKPREGGKPQEKNDIFSL